MIYTGLLSLLLAEYAAYQKRSAFLLCSADSIYPVGVLSTAEIMVQRRDGPRRLRDNDGDDDDDDDDYTDACISMTHCTGVR